MLDYLYALIIFASGYVLGWLLCYKALRRRVKQEVVLDESIIAAYKETVTFMNKALRDVANQRDAALRIVRAHDEMDKRISMN